jgi:hypothetical protein
MAGKAIPIMSRMKKMAEMSAMGDVLSVLVDVSDTGMMRRKLQFESTKSTKLHKGLN